MAERRAALLGEAGQHGAGAEGGPVRVHARAVELELQRGRRRGREREHGTEPRMGTEGAPDEELGWSQRGGHYHVFGADAAL
jgi:hypothetical protein